MSFLQNSVSFAEALACFSHYGLQHVALKKPLIITVLSPLACAGF
jgi:hypothetical protein